MNKFEIIGTVAAAIIAGVPVLHYTSELIKTVAPNPTPPTAEQIAAWGAKAAGHDYFQRVACGLDQFVNVLTGGRLDETISSRTSRVIRNAKLNFVVWVWIATWVIWLCDLVQDLHGVKAESGDLERAEEIVATEKRDLGLK